MLMQERSLAVQNHENKRNKWILDSGASSHVSYEKEYFNELNEDETSEIEIADGNVVKAIGAGTVNLKFNVDHETINTKITEVKFAPKLNCNLLSVSSLDRKGFKITFEKGQCIVTKHDEVYVEGKLKDGVYELNISENQRNQSTRMAQPSKRDQASVEPRSEEFVFYPFEPIQSTNPPSSVVTPPIGDTREDAEVQAPGSTRDEEDEEQLYGDIPLLEEDEEADAVERPEVRHSSRTYRGVPPLRLSYLTRSASPQEPSKWEEIERMPPDEASLWRKAAQEEIDALHWNRTWTLTELPPESQYIATLEACREIAWLDQLLKDFGVPRRGPVSLMEDNQSSIKLTQSEKFLARTKHIGVRYHYIRQVIEDGLVEMCYCNTEQMTADILTKPLLREKFQDLRGKLGLLGG
ncbi:uncharacterized protein LOC132593052 [Zootoca vivipara]|uniref:uncharacterized protein LOC132593052 n=1 Tax=Zootoca vivipara TaxID=8524 RepID=UPI00293BD610|nr:uncharacterized protein LOC132593052 [Zootoca vivipara]